MAEIIYTIRDLETGAIISLPEGEDAPANAETYAELTCSEDGSHVTISAVGTSEYATCRHGHRWQRLFSGAVGAADWVAR